VACGTTAVAEDYRLGGRGVGDMSSHRPDCPLWEAPAFRAQSL
jgi:hypothetical protein